MIGGSYVAAPSCHDPFHGTPSYVRAGWFSYLEIASITANSPWEVAPNSSVD